LEKYNFLKTCESVLLLPFSGKFYTGMVKTEPIGEFKQLKRGKMNFGFRMSQ
jgi:hypothetical protein